MNKLHESTAERERVYLSVPFHEKDAAKLHGAWFDGDRRKWWCTRWHILVTPDLRRWLPPEVAKLHGLQQRSKKLPKTRPRQGPLTPPAPAPCTCAPWADCGCILG